MPPRKAQKRKHPPEADESNDCDEDPEEAMDMSDEEGAVRVDGIYIPPPPKPPVTLEIRGSRLVITKINNYFFKSYAQEQILGPFHKVNNVSMILISKRWVTFILFSSGLMPLWVLTVVEKAT